MNKLFLVALLVSSPLFAQEVIEENVFPVDVKEEAATPVITTEEPSPEEQKPIVTKPTVPETTSTPVVTTVMPKEDRFFNPRKSHWLTSFGFEGMKYPTFNDFNGVKDNFAPNEQELWGGRIGVGGELYLGLGLITTTKIEGYYMGTLFSRELNGGAKDEDVKFAFTKRTGQVYGADASQAIGFLFDMKTKNPFMDEWTYLTVEPFVEAGIGVARGYNRLSYKYDLGNTDEAYRLRVVDELANAKLAAGINFTSSSGYFLYIKATQNRYSITSRKADQVRRDNGGSDTATKPDFGDKIDPITVYAIGGGYKF